MATVGVKNGTIMRLYADQAGGSTYTAVGNSLNVSLNFSHSVRETTSQDSGGNASFLEGKRQKTITFSALGSEDGTNKFKLWYDTLASSSLRGLVTCKVGNAVTGDFSYTYTGYITDLTEDNGGPEGNVQFNGTIQVTGAGAVAANA